MTGSDFYYLIMFGCLVAWIPLFIIGKLAMKKYESEKLKHEKKEREK
jgi:hypothetical protein